MNIMSKLGDAEERREKLSFGILSGLSLEKGKNLQFQTFQGVNGKTRVWGGGGGNISGMQRES